MAEFALVLPIFLLIVLGLVDLGRAVFSYTSITNAAREGARLAIVNQDEDLIKQRATEQTAVAQADVDELEVTFFEALPNADPMSNDECDPVRIGCVAVVEYTSKFQPITPFVGRIVFPSGVDLKAKTVLPVEFICPNTAIVAATDCPKQP